MGIVGMEGESNARGAVISPFVPSLKQCSSPNRAAKFLDNRTLELNYILEKKITGNICRSWIKIVFFLHDLKLACIFRFEILETFTLEQNIFLRGKPKSYFEGNYGYVYTSVYTRLQVQMQNKFLPKNSFSALNVDIHYGCPLCQHCWPMILLKLAVNEIKVHVIA